MCAPSTTRPSTSFVLRLPTSFFLCSTGLFVSSITVCFSPSRKPVQFKEFGVNFINATVTNVALPDDLSQILEEASKIESQIQEEIRSQEFELKKYNDEQDLKMKEEL